MSELQYLKEIVMSIATLHPLTPEELLMRDNEPPSKPIPKEISHQLATPRLDISLRGESSREDLRADRDASEKSVWHISGNAVLGLCGSRLEPLTVPKKTPAVIDGSSTKGFRPNWADLVYHPKFSFAPPKWQRPAISRNRRAELFWGVFGTDDRAVYYPSGYPWCCVGRIFVWNDANAANWSWSGSGVLVGPRHVLTAGHVVPWSSTSWKALFVPGYYDGTSVSGPGAQSWVTNAHGWDVSFKSRTPNAYDMAVMRLNDTLGDWLGWFGTRVYSTSSQIIYFNLTGYPGMIVGAERPSYQPGITVLDTDPNAAAMELEHQGDSTAGDSGAPFWATWSDNFPYSIGVVSGGEYQYEAKEHGYEDNNICAGGQAMIDLVNWAHTNWA